jgi:hypothetical protein
MQARWDLSRERGPPPTCRCGNTEHLADSGTIPPHTPQIHAAYPRIAGRGLIGVHRMCRATVRIRMPGSTKQEDEGGGSVVSRTLNQYSLSLARRCSCWPASQILAPTASNCFGDTRTRHPRRADLGGVWLRRAVTTCETRHATRPVGREILSDGVQAALGMVIAAGSVRRSIHPKPRRSCIYECPRRSFLLYDL